MIKNIQSLLKESQVFCRNLLQTEKEQSILQKITAFI